MLNGCMLHAHIKQTVYVLQVKSCSVLPNAKAAGSFCQRARVLTALKTLWCYVSILQVRPPISQRKSDILFLHRCSATWFCSPVTLRMTRSRHCNSILLRPTVLHSQKMETFSMNPIIYVAVAVSSKYNNSTRLPARLTGSGGPAALCRRFRMSPLLGHRPFGAHCRFILNQQEQLQLKIAWQ